MNNSERFMGRTARAPQVNPCLLCDYFPYREKRREADTTNNTTDHQEKEESAYNKRPSPTKNVTTYMTMSLRRATVGMS